MDIHPWTKYEIAHMRHEEQVLRGLAAYHALRSQQESAEPGAVRPASSQTRFLDRLLRRKNEVAAATARSAT